MGKDPCSPSTGITRENEPVVPNELEGIALKAKPAQPRGRWAPAAGKILKHKQTKPPGLYPSERLGEVLVNLLYLSPGKSKRFVTQWNTSALKWINKVISELYFLQSIPDLFYLFIYFYTICFRGVNCSAPSFFQRDLLASLLIL